MKTSGANRRWSSKTYVAVLAALALVLAACSADDEPVAEPDEPVAEPEPDEPEPDEPEPDEPEADAEPLEAVYRNAGRVVQVGDPNQYLAQVHGWYEELGLDITVGTADGSSSAVQLLIQGGADFVQVVPSALLAARVQGADIVAVCSVIPRESSRLAVFPDSPIESLEDLQGAIIGVPSMVSSSVYIARAAAAEAGLDPDEDITLVPVGFGPAALNALQGGDVDVLAFWTGFFAELEGEAGVEFRQMDVPSLRRTPSVVTVTRGEVVRDQPELVGRFLRTIAMGHEFAYANPEATVQAFWEAYPEANPVGVSDEEALAIGLHPLEVQLVDMDVSERADTRWCWNDPEAWQALEDFAREFGLLDDIPALAPDQDPEDFTVEDMYTNEFIDDANDFDAEAIRELARNS